MNTPPRVLMLVPQPFFTPRGTPFSVRARLEALSALGHHVDVVTYHPSSGIPRWVASGLIRWLPLD